VLAFREIVDLGHEVFANMPTLRGSQVAFWSYDTHGKIAQISGGRYSMESRLMLLGEHHGTHLDVPFHTFSEGATVDQVPLERLVLPGHLLDLTVKAGRVPIQPADLEAAVARSGRAIAPGSAVLAWTGQDQRWGAPDFTTERPYLPTESAEWLVAQGIGLFGTDLIGVDDPAEWWWPTHTAFARGDVLMVQQLCNLQALVGKEFLLLVIPLKLRGGTGSPVRPIALVT
jgi:kynurenine formamidase